MSQTHTRGRRRTGSVLSRRWQAAALALFLLALVSVCIVCAISFTKAADVFAAVSRISIAWITVATIAYLFSHLLRAIRLTMLAGSHEISLRRLSMVHFFTAGVSLLLPFKLGEAYRVIELGTVIGSVQRSMVIVWIERGFDVGALLVLTICAMSMQGAVALDFLPLAGVSVVFLMLTVVALIVLPENLQSLSLFILRRYRSGRAVTAMQIIHATLQLLKEGRKIMTGKFVVVGTVTVMIWLLELGTFVAVLSTLEASLGWMLEAFLGYVSSISIGTRSISDQLPLLLVYGCVVRTSLLFVGGIAGIAYAPGRLTRRQSTHSQLA